MSHVSETIVREYFESLGFVVSQPCKYLVPGRQKTAEEELDMMIFNPQVTDQKIPEQIVWETGDLTGVSRAIVAVRGWHTERFSKKTFESMPEILRFAQEATVRVASRKLGAMNVAKVLCLTDLPASDELKQHAVDILRQKGIDGVILFRTILQHLIGHVDRNRNYEKSDVLQMIRILKSYDLIKSGQMEFFGARRRKTAKKTVEG